MKRKLADKIVLTFIYLFIVCIAIICVYPLLLTLMVSFSNEAKVVRFGYSIIPRMFSLDAYRFAFGSLGSKILNGYKISIFVTIAGTFVSMVVSSAYAYAASMKSFKHRNILNFLIYVPMVFSAGILPWYIVLTRYYHLTNSIYALFVPAMMNLFFVFLIRNFFSNVPAQLSEAARIDGAGHIYIFISIYIPVARVGLITVALFYALNYWNDFYLALMFIRRTELFPLQYYLYNMLSNIQFISQQSNSLVAARVAPPLETIKTAITCIAIGPIILLYPLVQKYFVKGVIIGAVKG